jgi:hypothetical protein
MLEKNHTPFDNMIEAYFKTFIYKTCHNKSQNHRTKSIFVKYSQDIWSNRLKIMIYKSNF